MENKLSADRLSLEQSSVWVERLKLGNAEDRAAFDRWLLQSEDHVHHFLLMTALDQELRHLDPDRVVKIGKAQQPFLGWRSMAAVAAAVVLVAVGVNFLPPAEPSTEWKEYQTSLGEHPVIMLPDGTEVRLNGSVRMSARIVSSGAREVRLDGGEALFKVSHDGSRHFYVSTPEATLEALGTQFNVNVRKGGTVVDVVEGQVGAQANRTLEHLRIKLGMRKAETTVLTRGARAVINDSGDLRTERNPNVDQTVSWADGSFRFTNAPLWQIVEEFNRYNAKQIVLVGETVRQERRSGSYVADAPESLVREVEQTNGWAVRTLPNGNFEIRQD